MKAGIADDKITVEFDSNDETLGKEDILEALEFIWRQSDIDIPIEEMDSLWAQAKAKLGYVGTAYSIGRARVSGTKYEHEYVYVEFDTGMVQVKFDDEGVIVDVWDRQREKCLGTTGAEYDDLKGPCYRERLEGDADWTCMNDHTGCMWNDGHNGCNMEDRYGNSPDDVRDCGLCGGEGTVDSGGMAPHGNFVEVACPECGGKGVVPND